MVTPVRVLVLISGPAPYSASNLVTETAPRGTDQRLAGVGLWVSSASPRGPPLRGLQCASSHLCSWPPHRRHQGTHGVQPCTPPHARGGWPARPHRAAQRVAPAGLGPPPPSAHGIHLSSASGAVRTPLTPDALDASRRAPPPVGYLFSHARREVIVAFRCCVSLCLLSGRACKCAPRNATRPPRAAPRCRFPRHSGGGRRSRTGVLSPAVIAIRRRLSAPPCGGALHEWWTARHRLGRVATSIHWRARTSGRT